MNIEEYKDVYKQDILKKLSDNNYAYLYKTCKSVLREIGVDMSKIWDIDDYVSIADGCFDDAFMNWNPTVSDFMTYWHRYLQNAFKSEHKKNMAQKRGGGVPPIPLVVNKENELDFAVPEDQIRSGLNVESLVLNRVEPLQEKMKKVLTDEEYETVLCLLRNNGVVKDCCEELGIPRREFNKRQKTIKIKLSQLEDVRKRLVRPYLTEPQKAEDQKFIDRWWSVTNYLKS